MSALFVGDHHLSDGNWPGRPIFGDSYYASRQIISVARKTKPRCVVLCGDVVDRKRTNSRPIRELRWLISQLTKLGIVTYFVQGDHDRSDPPWCEIAGGVHLHNKMVDLDDDIKMTGLDCTDPLLLPEALHSLPRAQLLVCHQMWAEHKPYGPEPDGTLADIPLHIKIVVSGDIHRKKQLTITRGHSKHDLVFLSPGSTSMQDIVEDEKKYVWLLDGGKFQAIRIRTRPIIRVKSCTSEKQLLDALKLVAAELDAYHPKETKNELALQVQKPLVDFRYSKDLEDVEERVRKIVADRAFVGFRYFVDDEEEGDQFQSTVEWKSRATEAVAQALREETQDPEVHALATELLARQERTDERLKPILNRYVETGSCT